MSVSLNVAVLGAGGYTGGEILRLLLAHPQIRITTLTAKSKAGHSVANIHPHLSSVNWPVLCRLEDADFSSVDCVFCCLPHAASQETVASLPEHVRVIDLSADFRLRDPALYQSWYGRDHTARHLLDDAIYGLSEWSRHRLPTAQLVANPGCYATAILLALRPLIAHGLIDHQGITIAAASGVSGAGREAREDLLLSQAGESIKAYALGGHRHVAEIEQELNAVDPNRDKTAASPITFIPHLAPMTRGILATTVATMTDGQDVADLRTALTQAYQESAFVHILPDGHFPATKDVRGSNSCHIGLAQDRTPKRVILLSAIDNLVKGAAGQAIQNMNLMFGFPETTGLPIAGLSP